MYFLFIRLGLRGYAYLGSPHFTIYGQAKARVSISKIIIFPPVLELLQVLHKKIFYSFWGLCKHLLMDQHFVIWREGVRIKVHHFKFVSSVMQNEMHLSKALSKLIKKLNQNKQRWIEKWTLCWAFPPNMNQWCHTTMKYVNGCWLHFRIGVPYNLEPFSDFNNKMTWSLKYPRWKHYYSMTLPLGVVNWKSESWIFD
jgi:hypothetical protein